MEDWSVAEEAGDELVVEEEVNLMDLDQKLPNIEAGWELGREIRLVPVMKMDKDILSGLNISEEAMGCSFAGLYGSDLKYSDCEKYI